eukprot:2657010-Lingulodinium_polyedra.AAC.1
MSIVGCAGCVGSALGSPPCLSSHRWKDSIVDGRTSEGVVVEPSGAVIPNNTERVSALNVPPFAIAFCLGTTQLTTAGVSALLAAGIPMLP